MDNKKTIYLGINSLLLGYLALFQYPLPISLFLKTILINLIMYIVPGFCWIRYEKETFNPVVALFKIFFISIGTFIGLISLFAILRINPHPVLFWISTFLLSNLGIVCTKQHIPLKVLWNSPRKIILWGCIALISLSMYFSMQTIKPFRDLDGEHTGTAYGIIKEMKPYLNSDIVESTFYFAHPPLTNIFNAYSILLFNQTHHYQTYYESAKTVKELNKLKPDQTKEITKGERRIKFTRTLNQDFKVEETGQITSYKDNNNLIRYFYDLDRNHYTQTSGVFYARASNLFASILSFYLLYFIIMKLTSSPFLAIVAGLIFISSPGIFIRSSLSEHIAFTNSFILLLIYQFLFPKEFHSQRRGIQGKVLPFLPAFLAGLINQKIILLIFGIFLLRLYQFIKEGQKFSFKNILTFEPIITGYFLGMMVFWIYALLIDASAFLISHLQTHFFNRLIWHKTLFEGDYPNLLTLWKEFLIEFPYGLLVIIPFINRFKVFTKNSHLILILYPIVGAIIYSCVDWKQTNHLMCLGSSVIIATMMSFVHYKEKRGLRKPLLITLFIGILIWNLYFDINLLTHLEFYTPTSGW